MDSRVPLLLAVALTLGLPAAAHAGGLHVALGDSYTSAPAVPNQAGRPAGCLRSDRNYPSLSAAALGLTLRDVSCSGAKTKHMSEPQSVMGGESNPPQFDAVTPDAELVTVGIGGNDAGLVGVGLKCGELGSRDPNGTACRDFYTEGGRDRVGELIDAAAPKVAGVLQGIHQRAPGARVAIVGYPAVAPTDGTGCYPLVPASPDDLAYINELLIRINAMIAEQASNNGAEFVDTYTDSVGHDVCKLPLARWFEGLIPTAPAYPLHPNAEGEASMARSVLRVLRGPRPSFGAPLLASLAPRRPAVRVGPPARFSFTLDRAAGVTFTLQRRVADKRYGPPRSFVRELPAGRGGVQLVRSRLGRQRGAYKLTATPAAGGVVGRPVALRFRMSERRARRAR